MRMPGPRIDSTLTLRDGRVLGYAEFGDPAGTPGFLFHGHPGSRLEGELGHEAAMNRGVRIITLDRPGYGRSTFQPKRRILDWPNDVAQVADQLGITQFAVVGGSGGGPYALACGYALPGRVTKVGVVSGVAPYSAPHATEGMRWQNRVGFQLGARIPPLATLIMWSMARQVRKSPERVVEAVAKAMSGPDAEVVRRPEIQQMLARDLQESFRQGHRGAAYEVVLLGRAWGFDPAEVKPPAVLWQGEADVLVPPAMGRYLAGRIPDCTAHFLPGEGHLLMLNHIEEILDAFAEKG